MKFLLLMGTFVFSSTLMAVDSSKCSALINNGLWKKYRYMGVGESNLKALSDGTKKDGSSTVTSDGSTETSTATIDPKFTSNVWTSETQSTSSWGPCSMFADLQQLKKDRELYIAQNEPEILIDVARGNGEHIKVIAFYSACAQSAYKELGHKLQQKMSLYSSMPSSKKIASDIDDSIFQSEKLRQQCIVNI